MSFFDTEELHAVMLAYAADRGGRAALKVTPSSQDVDVCAEDRRPPGSSGKNRLKAPAQFGAKKDIHIPHDCHVRLDKCLLICREAKSVVELLGPFDSSSYLNSYA
jgi:hypothetical protein